MRAPREEIRIEYARGRDLSDQSAVAHLFRSPETVVPKCTCARVRAIARWQWERSACQCAAAAAAVVVVDVVFLYT